MKPDPTSSPRSATARQTWKAPRLTVHGDLRRLTATKRSHRNDGYGVPRTGSESNS